MAAVENPRQAPAWSGTVPARTFAAVLDELPERVYRVRRDGFVLASWGSADGQPPMYPDRGVGHNIRELLAPGPADQLARIVTAAVRGERILEQDIEIHDGPVVVALKSLRCVPFVDDDALVFVRDVTIDRCRAAVDEMLGRMTRDLFAVGSLDSPLLVRELLRQFCQAVGAVGASVWAPDDHAAMKYARAYTWRERRVTTDPPQLGFRSPSWVLETMEALTTPTIIAVDDIPRWASSVRTTARQHGLSVVGYVPVPCPDRPGMVTFGFPSEPGPLERASFEAFSGLGTLLASVLERDRSERYRVESDAKLRSLIGGDDIVVILDASGDYKWIGPSVQALTGYSLETLTSSDRAQAIHADDLPVVHQAVRASIAVPGEPLPVAFRMRFADGSDHHVVATVTNLLGVEGIEGIVFNARDVTEQREARVALEHAASHDELTDVANRATLSRRLQELLDSERLPVAIVFLDLDHFKRVNDSLGHTVGDQVLVEIANRLVGALGPTGLVARFAGDEFVALAPGVGTDAEVRDLSEELRRAVATPIVMARAQMRITASAGAILATPGGEPESLLRDADTALYEAKRQGRNRHVLFDSRLHDHVVRRVELETALLEAIADDQLAVHYQPIVQLGSARIVGVEALARWTHPELGAMDPTDFITVAEDIGIVHEVDTWVLGHAAAFAATWHRRFGITVAVNLSTQTLSRPDLAQSILRTLDRHRTPPAAIGIEVTETSYAQAPQTTIDALQALRVRGIRVSIDDFGTGYSSIERVRRFPVDTIKIDRTLIDAIPESTRDLAIVRAISDLAHALDLTLTAEGVTRTEQHGALHALGCDTAQGYLYGRPTTATRLEAELHRTGLRVAQPCATQLGATTRSG